MFAGTTSLTAANGQIVRSGDVLSWRQYQDGSALGGFLLNFTDNSPTNGVLLDSDGQPINADTTKNVWHQRRVDLSAYAGKTIQLIDPFDWTTAPAGAWDIYYGDISITRADGTVIPIYNRSMMTLSLATNPTVSNFSAVTEKVVNGSPITATVPNINASYYLYDHLGTSQMEVSSGGWPVWQGQFTPFGSELDTQFTPMHYKFTGKEQDTESGLDYFGARYYASDMGRFMSPDWSAQAEPVPYSRLDDPQSLNLYGYVGNNPLSKTDPDGHCWPVCTTWFWQAVNILQLARNIVGNGIVSFLNQGAAAISDPTGRSQTMMAIGMMAGAATPVPEAEGGTISGVVDTLETESATTTGLIGMPSLQGFSATETSMIQTSIGALQGAGYDTSGLSVLIRADMPEGYSAMSLSSSPTGAALGDGAFSSQDMLNHTLEEELLHVSQDLSSHSFGPGDAAAKENEVDAVRKFPEPHQ